MNAMVRSFRLLLSGWRLRKWALTGKLAWHAPGTPCVCRDSAWAWMAETTYRSGESRGEARSAFHRPNKVKD